MYGHLDDQADVLKGGPAGGPRPCRCRANDRGSAAARKFTARIDRRLRRVPKARARRSQVREQAQRRQRRRYGHQQRAEELEHRVAPPGMRSARVGHGRRAVSGRLPGDPYGPSNAARSRPGLATARRPSRRCCRPSRDRAARTLTQRTPCLPRRGYRDHRQYRDGGAEQLQTDHYPVHLRKSGGQHGARPADEPPDHPKGDVRCSEPEAPGGHHPAQRGDRARRADRQRVVETPDTTTATTCAPASASEPPDLLSFTAVIHRTDRAVGAVRSRSVLGECSSLRKGGVQTADYSPQPCPLVRGELLSGGDSPWAAGLPGRTGWRPTGSGAGRRRWG